MEGDELAALANPILSSPYDPPERHFELGPAGPTGNVVAGRRPSESFIPIPVTRKGAGDAQESLDFDLTGERREVNSLINDIRAEVELWRARGYPGVTPYSRKLLTHWAPGPHRDDPVLFCQREAAETAIFLVEVAGRSGSSRDFRRRLDPENATHNAGLPRVALKMATGSGKTVVMAMLVAWQTVNKVHSPRDARFAKQFLVVAPGITIRDRLRVLQPGAQRDDNYYLLRDLVPPDLMGALLQAQVVITNYHSFLLRDAKEIKGVAATTRRILNAGKAVDPFKETEDQMVSRVLADFGRGSGGEIVVFNDEAHHCYQDRPLTDPSEADKEDKDRNADARVWFKGLQAIRRKVGIKTVFDLSATPYYLKGSGWNEGYIFPWTVSDFSLMDAIESGIVKVPRIPVDDDAAGEQVTYLHLWDAVGAQLPKTRGRKAATDAEWVPPAALEGALQSLYRSYRSAFERWRSTLESLGEPPPVFIVVCPNTIVSKLVHDWIAGVEVRTLEVADPEADGPDGPYGATQLRAGRLPLLSNVDEHGEWIRRSPTILIDSAQLESGEAMKADFKAAAAGEIEHFKRELVERGETAKAENLTDEDLLREVMNTVGKRGRIGEHVRCVVSVGMLTEGWDANTVTHILGIRAFRSQLLCEQVVGRGLRRRDWSLNDEGRFEPEYADIYGVPFAFIPGDGDTGPEPPPKPPAVMVQALPGRAEHRITFPKLDGYRVEMPDEGFAVDFDEDSHWVIRPSEVATWVELSPVVGEHAEVETDELRSPRPQRIAYEIARVLMERHHRPDPDDRTPWLFEQLVQVSRQWLTECVTTEGDAHVGMLLLTEATHRAAELVNRGLVRRLDDRHAVLQPILQRFDPEGSTDDVAFASRKPVVATTRSHVSHVVCDSGWERGVAEILEGHRDVAAYVKNDHLGFEIPYVHQGRSYSYLPDFLIRLVRRPGDDVERTLILEVSGAHKKLHAPGPTEEKSHTARQQWCPAVNNHGGFGRWGYAVVSDMTDAGGVLNAAIASLYADGPVTGDPDPIDLDQT